jgi:hypothetical protein
MKLELVTCPFRQESLIKLHIQKKSSLNSPVIICILLVIISFSLLFQVAKLFQKIQEMVEEESNLVFVLIGKHPLFVCVNLFVCSCIRCTEFANTRNCCCWLPFVL